MVRSTCKCLHVTKMGKFAAEWCKQAITLRTPTQRLSALIRDDECNRDFIANYEAGCSKLFPTLFFSMTMQYTSLQFLCHFQPFLAPGALASLYEAAT